MESSRWATNTENIPIRDHHQPQDNTMDHNSTQQDPKTASNPSRSNKQKPAQTFESSTDDREAALRHELESVRRMNQVIEGVTSSLEKARSNMGTINQTVTNARSLLDTWTRILSQTEHNQRLILNPAWQGASQDLADAENETLIRQRERERREAEEAQRRAAAEERKRAEDERRRVEAEKRETAASSGSSRGARPGVRVGGTRGTGVITRGGRSTPGVGGVGAGAGSAANSTMGRTGTPAGSGPSKTGRGAIAGYGRVGSVGTKSSRGRGRGVG